MNKYLTSVVFILGMAVWGAPDAYAEGIGLKTSFRTDLGIYLSGGGNMCISGGSGTAVCDDVDGGWDPSFGISGGMIMRPFPFLSFGLDLAYMNMTSRFTDLDGNWGDLYVGPFVRAHLPIHFGKVTLDPNVGMGSGLVVGFLQEGKYSHEHLGPFFSALFNLDIYPIPSFGVGFEARVSGTFYQEVCFKGSSSEYCRGTDDDFTAIWYDKDPDNENLNDWQKYPGDIGNADYPWKTYLGGRIIYFF